MTRYDRSQHFEALVRLRLAYDQASDDDRRSVLSIDDAITYADAVMSALAAEDALADLEADANAVEQTSSAEPRD
jgi:hypothetical protein